MGLQNKNQTDLFLGVSPIGLHMFEKADKLHPQTTFNWCDVRNISFKHRKVSVSLFVYDLSEISLEQTASGMLVWTSIPIVRSLRDMPPYI